MHLFIHLDEEIFGVIQSLISKDTRGAFALEWNKKKKEGARWVRLIIRVQIEINTC